MYYSVTIVASRTDKKNIPTIQMYHHDKDIFIFFIELLLYNGLFIYLLLIILNYKKIMRLKLWGGILVIGT